MGLGAILYVPVFLVVVVDLSWRVARRGRQGDLLGSFIGSLLGLVRGEPRSITGRILYCIWDR